ncbi:MAG: hypothetical protein PF486_08035 [Prolixibacteraceae bacterium]|jgi:hypothetical protein|nr:hypothetical protein [Prolixibacteraceae bacterium]
MKHFLLFFIVLLPALLPAQNYNRSLGVRTGSSRSIFYEIPNDGLSSYRFMLTSRNGGQNVAAMKIFRHYRMPELPEYLTFYYGYGAHAGYVRWKEEYDNRVDRHFSAPIAGLDALVGLAYDFTEIPVSLTIDARPFFDYGGANIFSISPGDICLGAILHF